MPENRSNLFSLRTYLPASNAEPKLAMDKSLFFKEQKNHPEVKKINIEKALKKSLSFRVFATLGTFAVAFAFTGNPIGSVSIATAQAITNTTIYYYHEKFWDKKKNAA